MENLSSALHHTCDECDSEFVVRFDRDTVEDDPQYCPFCGSYIVLDSEYYNPEDEEDI